MQKAHHTDSTKALIMHRYISFPHWVGYTQYNINLITLMDPKRIIQGLILNYSTLEPKLREIKMPQKFQCGILHRVTLNMSPKLT